MVTGHLSSVDVGEFLQSRIPAESRYITASTMSDTSPIRPIGCSEARNGWASSGCIGVLMIPGETAFTRTPFLAYSIASDFVAAFKAPLVKRCKHSRHAGHRLVDQAGRDSHDMTASLLVHDLYRTLGHVKEARDIGRQYR